MESMNKGMVSFGIVSKVSHPVGLKLNTAIRVGGLEVERNYIEPNSG